MTPSDLSPAASFWRPNSRKAGITVAIACLLVFLLARLFFMPVPDQGKPARPASKRRAVKAVAAPRDTTAAMPGYTRDTLTDPAEWADVARHPQQYTYIFNGEARCFEGPCDQVAIDAIALTPMGEFQTSGLTDATGGYRLALTLWARPHEPVDWMLQSSEPFRGLAETSGRRIAMRDEKIVVVSRVP